MRRINVLGVGVSAVDLDGAAAQIEAWIASGSANYVTVTGVHGVMESHDDPDLRAVHNRAGLVVPDGMPMVWVGKLSGFRDVDRVYGPDLMLEMCRRSVAAGYTHFLYGGAPDVPPLLAERLRARFQGLRIVGMHSPPFRSLTDAELDEDARAIDASGADIVWVGLGTPKQERWMAAMVARLEKAVLVGVGAAFDFHAGLKKQAPHWMQRSGLEWFYRMVSEPRRLARRYLRNNPRFVWLIAQQAMGLRRFPSVAIDPTPPRVGEKER